MTSGWLQSGVSARRGETAPRLGEGKGCRRPLPSRDQTSDYTRRGVLLTVTGRGFDSPRLHFSRLAHRVAPGRKPLLLAPLRGMSERLDQAIRCAVRSGADACCVTFCVTFRRTIDQVQWVRACEMPVGRCNHLLGGRPDLPPILDCAVCLGRRVLPPHDVSERHRAGHRHGGPQSDANPARAGSTRMALAPHRQAGLLRRVCLGSVLECGSRAHDHRRRLAVRSRATFLSHDLSLRILTLWGSGAVLSRVRPDHQAI